MSNLSNEILTLDAITSNFVPTNLSDICPFAMDCSWFDDRSPLRRNDFFGIVSVETRSDRFTITGLNKNHCLYFFFFGTERRTPFGDSVVTTSGPKGFFLNFHIGIVHEILPGWQNFKSPVEIYHGHLKFCRISRILKVLGYRAEIRYEKGGN